MRDQSFALFNQKTIDRLCSQTTITDEQHQATAKWIALLKTGALDKEKKNYFKFALIVLRDILGYDVEKDLDFEE